MNVNTILPSRELYNQVRAGFIIKGDTLSVWCRENGISPTNAKQCLMGSWDGPKAKTLRKRIIKASRIQG